MEYYILLPCSFVYVLVRVCPFENTKFSQGTEINWLLYLIGKCSGKLSFKYLDFALRVGMWLIIKGLCLALGESNFIMSLLSLKPLYWLYLIIGYLLRKYNVLEKTATYHGTIMIVCVVVYVLLMFMVNKGLYFPFQGMIKGFVAIVGLLLFTMSIDFSFNEKKLCMVSLGTWTLDIYIYHYFFLI